MKNLISTQTELEQIPIKNRRHFYLDRDLIATVNKYSHSDELMVDRYTISKSGIIVSPFWDDGVAIDEEGVAFLAYMKKHPDFGMMIRSEVLSKLLHAQSLMPKNWKIVIKAGFRPIEVQRHLFQDVYTAMKKKHKAWSHQKLYATTLTYVTDPDKFIPPHATGGAVDIHILDSQTGNYLDVGSPINAAGDESWCDNHAGLSKLQTTNRETLILTMISAGFANLASEWWHYSYGDPRWALFYDQKIARYPTYNYES